MSKITTKDLATSLTDKYGLSRQDAELFASSLFDVIAKALHSDKQVKVKGLGTFKVISVAPRRSVDVNTGESIVIEGRDKISFTPDTSLRDEVNKPFADFDTVVVNEGVDFSTIDQKYSQEDNNHNESKKPVTDTVEEDIKAEFPDDSNNSDSIEKTDKIDNQENTNESKEANVAESHILIDVPTDDKLSYTPQQDENTTETKADDIQNNTQELVKAEDNTSTNVTDELLQEVRHQHRTMKAVVIACAVIIVVCIAGAFYMFSQIQNRDHRIENLEAQILGKKSNSPTHITKKATSSTTTKDNKGSAVDKQTDNKGSKVSSNQDIAMDASPKPTSNAKEVKEKKSSPAHNTANDIKSDKHSTYDNDPRVRTGAYNIVGIFETVTVKPGQTLSSISKFYLGSGMECYVEAVNGGKTEFKAGDKVKIPTLELKKRRNK